MIPFAIYGYICYNAIRFFCLRSEFDMYVMNQAKQVKTKPLTRKKYTVNISKHRKVLDYNAVQERKEMVENRLVRKVF